MTKDSQEPGWFKGFRKEFDDFREEQAKFNREVTKNFELLFSLPTIQQEIKAKSNKKENSY